MCSVQFRITQCLAEPSCLIYSDHWISEIHVRSSNVRIRVIWTFMWSGRLMEVKNNRKFQTIGPKSDCGCVSLQEVPNIVIWLGKFWYFGKVVAYGRLSVTRGGRTGRFYCTKICSSLMYVPWTFWIKKLKIKHFERWALHH